MTDDLVERHIEQLRLTGGDLADLCQPLADAIETLTAERDRLREALGAFVAHYPKGINPDLDAACFAARAALKGETP